MFKTTQDVAVLAVCVNEPPQEIQTEGLTFCSVNSARRAIDMLRMLRFDLLLVGPNVPDISTWEFVRRAKIGWPWQKWALVGERITEQQEITARMMGVTKVFETFPTPEELLELTSALRARAAQAVLNGTYEAQAEQAKLRSAVS
jgi:DNA-binding response OmpR family regulator